MAKRSDALADALIQHHVRVQGLSAGEVRKFAPFLKDMDRAIRKRLLGDELTTLTRARLEATLRAVDRELSKVYAEYRKQLDADLKAFGTHEAAFTVQAVAHTAEITLGEPSAAAIAAAIRTAPLSMRGPEGGKLLDAFLDDWSAKDTERVSNAIRRGVAEGQTNSQMVKAIRGTKAANYNDGILAINDRNARAVVQTAVNHVSTQARQAVADANADIVKGVRWVATLDQHTCAICRSLDGRVFLIDKGPRPPIHVNDRCTMVFALKGESMVKGAERPAVVGSKATQVPATETYYEWISRQPAWFQDEVLGPTRGKLLRDGGLSAKRFAALMLDRQFQPLTLKEMQQIETAAFRRAGITV